MPLSATAEQIYLAALTQGYASKDDSAMVRQYYPSRIADVSNSQSPEASESALHLQLVFDLMRSIHLVAAAEAIAFARHLQVDFAQFYDLVSNAAGASVLFNERAWEMYSGTGVTESPSLDDAITRLEAVAQKARDLYIPLHLGNAALNVLSLARRRGDGAASTGVMRVFS